MSIHGIPATNLPSLYPTRPERPAVESGDVGPAHGKVSAPNPQAASATPRQAEPTVTRMPTRPISSVPADAPEGVDPQLWGVLTADERAFFARTVSQGPLTYTRMMTQLNKPSPAAMPRGGRMDVRV